MAEIEKLREDLARLKATDDSLSLACQVASSFEAQLLAVLGSNSTKTFTVCELHDLIKGWGDYLQPIVRSTSNRVTGCANFGIAENVVSNIIRRLLRILHAEALLISPDSQQMTGDSLMDEPIHRLLTGASSGGDVTATNGLQEAPPTANIVEALTEYGYELESLRDSLKNRAAEFARESSASSRVMVLGRSRSTAAFLQALSKFHSKRSPGGPSLSLLVAETGMFSSQTNQEGSDALAFVGDLKKLGMQEVFCIDDHSWYALLVPRGHSPSAIRMVVISALAVLADGSVLAAPGASFLALAAQRGALPVIIVAPQYKLTPAFRISNASPRFDVLNPKIVNFIVTDIGTFSPAAISKAMAELYGLPDASTCFSA